MYALFFAVPLMGWAYSSAAGFPIVLFGTAYWQGLIDWLRDTMLPDGKINEADLDLVLLTDDVDEAVAHFDAVASE